MKGFLSEERPIRTLREVMQRLKESYCGSIGYEASSLVSYRDSQFDKKLEDGP